MTVPWVAGVPGTKTSEGSRRPPSVARRGSDHRLRPSSHRRCMWLPSRAVSEGDVGSLRSEGTWGEVEYIGDEKESSQSSSVYPTECWPVGSMFGLTVCGAQRHLPKCLGRIAELRGGRRSGLFANLRVMVSASGSCSAAMAWLCKP